MEYKVIEGGGITSPKGFTAGAVYVGVKSRKSQKPDVAVLYSETEASCAAVFTTNKFCAAPVILDREILKNGKARAIVTQPKVMLLDEPLSNLDPKLRESMRFEIKELQAKFNFTIIFVTHDQSEAMAISDRMMVCDMGKIMQIDTPENLYNKPVNRFVHSFLGESTFLNVSVRDGKVFADGDAEQALNLAIPPEAADRMVVATRPNAIELTGGEDGYVTHVAKRIFLTDRTEYLIPVGSQTLKVQTPHRVSFSEGEKCCVRLVNPMWYPAEDEAAEKERARRQTI